MAANSAPVCTRYRADGVWRLDNLEGGVCRNPERVLDNGGVCMHGAFGKGRNSRDLVRAWAVLAFIAATSSAAGTAGILQLIGR